jgi:hypothetical protein
VRRRGFLAELPQELRRLCVDDLDLLLYIAKTLANRGFRRRPGRGQAPHDPDN